MCSFYQSIFRVGFALRRLELLAELGEGRRLLLELHVAELPAQFADPCIW